jgi:murein DD-endopeptidase MepM/ murein hydrolase activator NlpD
MAIAGWIRMWSLLSLTFIVLQLLGCPRNALAQYTANSNMGASAREPGIAPPILGIKPYELRDSFNEVHSGHQHQAIDIMEPEGTPVRAVVDGTIQKLFLSRAGGNTIYEFDEKGVYCYYYAHLERYADGLHDGMHVSVGEIIGYVGSTGDASPAAPHLHFAINVLGPQKHWWEGVPIDPYPVLERSVSITSRSSSTPIYIMLEMLHAAS